MEVLEMLNSKDPRVFEIMKVAAKLRFKKGGKGEKSRVDEELI